MSQLQPQRLKVTPTSFLSLPREIRQAILFITPSIDIVSTVQHVDSFLSCSLQMALHKRNQGCNSWLLKLETRKQKSSNVAAILREVDPAIVSDVDYVERKWKEALDMTSRWLCERVAGINRRHIAKLKRRRR